MEVTSLRQASVPARPAPGPLLRLASDERLIALIRRGHHSAFEALVQRYQSRLLAFCRHMLGSREDAEDVLQDVFAAAFNAILADERAINVRPWLYRIARNRSLNHLRRATAVGVDSMDTYFADHGQSVPERILQRESFNALVDDIGHLAETQRTALLLREIDALSYEQIAEVMDTTVPSVKSLLVRARVALAEAAEARQLSCEEVREELAEVEEGLLKISPPVRRHVRECERCRAFGKQLKHNQRALAALLPVAGLPALFHRLLATKLGSGGAAAASSGGAGSGAAGVAAGAGAASGLGGVGFAGIGGGAVAAKAVAGLAAAALLTAGAVEVDHSAPRAHVPATHASASTYSSRVPAVVSSAPQAVTVAAHSARATVASHRKGASAAHAKHHHHALASKAGNNGETAKAASADTTAAAHDLKSHDAGAPVTLVSASTTQPPTQSSSETAAPTAAPTGPSGPTGEGEVGATGATGVSEPVGATGATGEAAPPAGEAPAPVQSQAEQSSGGAQAPPSAAEEATAAAAAG
jgi:RNA polymerase sigma factor (sigma-70 family)